MSELQHESSKIAGRIMPADAIPPQNVDAEEAVLGGILLDPEAIGRLGETLNPKSFYMGAHEQIFRGMQALHKQDIPTDLMTVSTWLKDNGLLEKVGGRNKLIRLLDYAISSANIDHYAELVAEKYKRRSLIAAAQEIIQMAHNSTLNWEGVQRSSEQKIFSFTESASQKGLRPLSDYVMEEYDQVERIWNGEESAGIKTGFYDLDDLTGGFRPGNLIVVGGRPGQGKSAIAAAFARNIAEQGLPVALFSLEMSGGEIAQRLWAQESSISMSRISTARIRDDEWEGFAAASSRISELPIWIDDSESISPTTILSQSRRLKSEQGKLGVVIIDYLHLMLDSQSDDDVKQISKITRQSKMMARALGAPVILVSQLNRESEGRNDKRPKKSDLRGSGSIEQDANMIIFVYRDEYYNPDTVERGIMELILDKNRNGPTGTVKILCELEFSRFRNLARSRPMEARSEQYKTPAKVKPPTMVLQSEAQKTEPEEEIPVPPEEDLDWLLDEASGK